MSARVPPAPPAGNSEQLAAEAQIRASRNHISPLYAVLLNSLPIARGWESLLTAIRQQTGLPASLRELIILRIAVLNAAPYEFDAHVPHARAAGLDDAKIAALRTEERARFDALEQLVLDYTDTLTREIRIPDALFDRVRAAFDAQGIVELTATIAAYNMVSRFLVALDVH
jgi:AhpD family alkylhydroperoxidase